MKERDDLQADEERVTKREGEERRKACENAWPQDDITAKVESSEQQSISEFKLMLCRSKSVKKCQSENRNISKSIFQKSVLI